MDTEISTFLEAVQLFNSDLTKGNMVHYYSKATNYMKEKLGFETWDLPKRAILRKLGFLRLDWRVVA